jgi:hypothetical protein
LRSAIAACRSPLTSPISPHRCAARNTTRLHRHGDACVREEADLAPSFTEWFHGISQRGDIVTVTGTDRELEWNKRLRLLADAEEAVGQGQRA